MKSVHKNENQTAIIVKKKKYIYLDNGITFILQFIHLHILEAKTNNNLLPGATRNSDKWFTVTIAQARVVESGSLGPMQLLSRRNSCP